MEESSRGLGQLSVQGRGGASGAEAEAGAQEAGGGTRFQDLDDEALGLIWAALSEVCYKYGSEGMQARHSLRQACRAVAVSPAVNAQIRRLRMNLGRYGGPEEAVGQLLCFPRAASLREFSCYGALTRSPSLGPFFACALNSAAACTALRSITNLSIAGWKSQDWEQICRPLVLLCPEVQSLTLCWVESPFSAQPLQQLRSLRSLELYVDMGGQALGAALRTLTGLSMLRHLSVVDMCDEPDFTDFSALGQLQGLTSLQARLSTSYRGRTAEVNALGQLQGLRQLDIWCSPLKGLPAIATGCSQLSRLVLSAFACGAGRGEAVQGSTTTSSNTSGSTPWWPSLQQVELEHPGAERHIEPGHITPLHLDRAAHLTRLSTTVFDRLSLEDGSAASSPEVLHELCRQLAALPAGLCPGGITLLDCRKAGGSLSEHLAALPPLAYRLKALTVQGCAGFDAAAAGTLGRALPALQHLSLLPPPSSAHGEGEGLGDPSALLPSGALVVAMAGLPHLQHLHLGPGIRLSSPGDVAQAAVAAEQQARSGCRTQRLTIHVEGMLSGPDAVPGVAAAVAEVAAQLSHVEIT